MTNPDERDDAALVAAVLAGDQRAFTQLMRRHKDGRIGRVRIGTGGPQQPHVGFVHQRRGLERLPRLLLGQLGSGQFSQFVIHQRQQLLGRAWVAVLNLRENLRDIGHFDQDTAEEQELPLAVLPAASVRGGEEDRLQIRPRQTAGGCIGR